MATGSENETVSVRLDYDISKREMTIMFADRTNDLHQKCFVSVRLYCVGCCRARKFDDARCSHARRARFTLPTDRPSHEELRFFLGSSSTQLFLFWSASRPEGLSPVKAMKTEVCAGRLGSG